MHRQITSFLVAVNSGELFFFKNEFYEDNSSNETYCVFTKIDEILSTVVGMGYTDQGLLFGVGYQNGTIATYGFPSSNQISLNQRFDLGIVNMIHFSIGHRAPVGVTIDGAYKLKLWTFPQTARCIFTVDLLPYFPSDESRLLSGGLLELINENSSRFPFLFAVDKPDQKLIEICIVLASNVELYHQIKYCGEITCSAFNGEEQYFVFYEKGGDNEGVHVLSLKNKRMVAHFTPFSKQQKHPIGLSVGKDKVWCIYKDGMMDMWHCDLDRYELITSSLKKIVQALPNSLKIQFLKQFGAYQLNQTDDGYDLVVSVASKGLPKDQVTKILFFLQYLNLRKLRESQSSGL